MLQSQTCSIYSVPIGQANVSTTSVGNLAERAAAEYLTRVGYIVLEVNYRRPHCEIDIVARRSGTVYFVEVKYRSTDHCGAGLDYIASHKLRHMQRGAETWVLERRWDGEYALSAIEVGGSNYEVIEFIESIY